jgi:replicative DNA helicase
MVYASYPQMKQPEREAYSSLFAQLRSVEVRDEVLQDILKAVATRAQAREIALAAFEVSEGRSSISDLNAAFNSLAEVEKADGPSWQNSRNFVTDDLFEIEKHTVKSPGLRWRLHCLNRSLGPLREGDFGFVFARPESGKTTFLADQITNFAEQATRPIIWFNNEEQGEKVRLRTFQASLGLTSDELWSNKTKHLERYRSPN